MAFQCSSAVPQGRIVSDNPCVDVMLHDLADADQIGAISAYSQRVDATSVPLDWAARFPALSGAAEDVIAARPRLYLTGAPANPATQTAVTQANIPTQSFAVPITVAESEAQIRMLGRALDHPERAEALIRRIEAATSRPSRTAPVEALIYQPSGLILGPGTLADDELARADISNAARRYTNKPWDVLPLEQVIMNPPALILTPSDVHGADRRALTLLQASTRKSGKRIRIANFSQRLLYCGAGSIIKARQRLNEVTR
jgi:iron complex transport system substrate-binding protein